MRDARVEVAKCVHCGFCLPACPTYLIDAQEMDSPRGRIYLAKAVDEGRSGVTAAFVTHIDRCLGCLACVSACPSGVGYAPIVEQARARIEASSARHPVDRAFRAALFALLPYPGRLRVLALLAAVLGPAWRPLRRLLGVLLPARARALVALAPPVRLRDLRDRLPEFTPAAAPRRLRVAVVRGCVQRVFFGRVNAATVRVLAVEGCDVWTPEAQGCCGALSQHAGRDEEARVLARALVASLDRDDIDRIVTNAAGCGSTLKAYGDLLADDPVWADRGARFAGKVRDISEVLVELGEPRAPRHPIAATVAYHDACHLAHGQGLRAEPRALLQQIPGVDLVPLAESDVCCGSAGIYNIIEPARAASLGARKATHVSAAAPDIVATGNPGCMLQIATALARLGTPIRVVHPIEIVDRSIRGVPFETERAGM